MRRILLAFLTLIALMIAVDAPTATAEEIRVHLLMNLEPDTPVQTSRWLIHPRLVPLWRQALARPESELKRRAAEAIVTASKVDPDAMKVAIPDLLNVVTADDVHPAARLMAAHALIVLDSRDSAKALMDASQKRGMDLRQMIEPALARWNYEPMRAVWRKRIASINTPRRDLVLAIEGLAEQSDTEAVEPLVALAIKIENPADVRIAAARAAGRIATEGLEKHSEQLLARGRNSVLERLCAGALVARRRSAAATQILQAQGRDPEPTVAAQALRSLFAMDPDLVLPLVESALVNPDANVRQVGIETYLALPNGDRIKSLSLRLNDPHPGLRGKVREGLFVLSKDKTLDPTIRDSTLAILAGNDWRGQEQGGLLLAALHEERAEPRLLELLDSPRPEVMITAAWSLKTLALPTTTKPVLEYARAQSDAPGQKIKHRDQQMSHLFELLGRAKSREAVDLMERYVPEGSPYGPAARAAAVWGLGLIQEGNVNELLSKQLMERVLDTMAPTPEDFDVRRASVLTLGRLRAKPQVAGLKELVGDAIEPEIMELTIRWSILQITGETLAISPPLDVEQSGWFLE